MCTPPSGVKRSSDTDISRGPWGHGTRALDATHDGVPPFNRLRSTVYNTAIDENDRCVNVRLGVDLGEMKTRPGLLQSERCYFTLIMGLRETGMDAI